MDTISLHANPSNVNELLKALTLPAGVTIKVTTAASSSIVR